MRQGVIAIVLVACMACGNSTARPHPSTSPTAFQAQKLCFKDPPADWTAAMSKTVANLPGANFGLIAVDDFNQVAYGYLQTASGGGIWGVDLRDGSDFLVSRMSASESGVIWASFWGGWLVWAQGESREVIGDWTIHVW